MGRIIAIDYGTKRVGLAVTDPEQIIATPLQTVHSMDVMAFLRDYTARENVECFVVGEPRKLDNTASSVTPQVEAFVRELKRTFPGIPVERIDERFTSQMASQTLIMAGVKKMDRRKKELVDQVSAVIILQSYMEARKNK